MTTYEILRIAVPLLAVIVTIVIFLLKRHNKKSIQTKVTYDTLQNGKKKFLIKLVAMEIGVIKDIKLEEYRTGLKYNCDYKFINDSTALFPGENIIEVIPQSDKYEYSDCDFIIETSSGKSLNYVKSFDSGSINISPASVSAGTKSFIGSVIIKEIKMVETIEVAEKIEVKISSPNPDN